MSQHLRGLLRRILFQLHWIVGIVAGTVLMIIGLSGAILSFEDEWLDALDPGVRQLAPQAGHPLTPGALIDALPPLPAGQRPATFIFTPEPNRSVEVLLQAKPDGEKLLPQYAHPWTAQWLGPARGQEFFEWVEVLHRFILLPRDAGKLLVGTCVTLLFLLIATGLYLRWPQKPLKLLSWRTWLTFGVKLKGRPGRPVLWAFHAIIATWVLPLWIVAASTGIYWAFDPVRDVVDAWAGLPQRAPRMAKAEKPKEKAKDAVKEAAAKRPEVAKAWQAFAEAVPNWRELPDLRLRPPAKADGTMEVLWLKPDAAHPRERNRMLITLDGRIKQDDRFADYAFPRKAQAAIHPLHMGRFFGMPGRIAMTIGALALPAIGFTGWWLYLQRRRQQREAARMRRDLATAGSTGREPILIAWASQTGRAESLALRTAGVLQAAGRAVTLRPLAALAPAELAGHGLALFVVSTAGQGQPPDAARGFAAAIDGFENKLAGLRFAVLALGNRQYPHFAAFGRRLHARLAELGAEALQPAVPLADDEPAALDPWFAGLAQFGASDAVIGAATSAAHDAEPWQYWHLQSRTRLNPGSAGEPLMELALVPPAGQPLPHWEPGALIEVLPPREGTDEPVPRRYSVASIAQDGALQIIVRLQRKGDDFGLSSGHLTTRAELGSDVPLRLLPNPSFTVPADERPCIFIGNGSGIAGLRGLLRERMRLDLGANWLVFGERDPAHDALCAEELSAWAAQGLLRVDRVYSRAPGGGYVQDFLRRNGDELRRWLDEGAVLHVCGSLQGMARGVEDVLTELLGAEGVTALAMAGRYRRDVY